VTVCLQVHSQQTGQEESRNTGECGCAFDLELPFASNAS